MKHVPYYYIIGWSALDKWYVGCRFAAICHPSDFWVKYFTSSTYVREFRLHYGEPDVLWTFPTLTAQDAIAAEYRIMNEFNNFLLDDRWLNKNVGGLIVKDDQVKTKISNSLTGRKLSDATKSKMSKAHKGKIKTKEHKMKIAERNRAKASDPNYRKKLSEANYKKWASEETRLKMLQNRPNLSKRYECDGEMMTIKEISSHTGIKIGTLYWRLSNNKPLV